LINEPLPIVYERIVTQFPKTELDAKTKLAIEFQQMKHNEIHSEIMSLPFWAVFTTNYDHCLEISSGHEFEKANTAREFKYSFFYKK